MTTISSELDLPSNAGILSLVASHVRELARHANFPQDKIEVLERSVLEAATNIIHYAGEPGAADTFRLRMEVTPSMLTVSLLDQGMPFDPTLEPPCSLPPDSEGRAENVSGSGLCLVRNLVDRMEWINHGRAGKELRLTLYNRAAAVTQQSSVRQLVPFQGDELPAQEQTYQVRRLRFEDAPWVSRLVFRAYGYTYPIEDLYYPERLVKLNKAGRLVSAVVESASGEIVGHCALKRPTLGPIAEVGQAVVNPAHRGRKLLERMLGFLEQEANTDGVAGLAAAAVTSHVFSQKSTENLGWKVCGLLLGLLPQTLVFRKLRDEPLLQRESCLLYFKYVKPPETGRIYAPAHHRELLQTIYGQLGIPMAFQAPGAINGVGHLEVKANSALGVGEILVRQIGTDTAAEVRQARRDLCDLAGAAVVYLQLPLSQPGAPEICRLAEQEGFFFSALCPGFAEEGDALRLQYLNTNMDLTQVRAASPWAQEMVAYVAAERARVERFSS